jgi:PIN domain nuclease of toxin-antitoxin system
MTVLLDAFAVIATLAGEPAADWVEKELRAPQPDVRISAVNLAEVYDQLVRVGGVPERTVDEKLEAFAAAGVSVLAVDEAIGKLAGMLRARHYDKVAASLSLADCVALATAIRADCALATADPALATIARLEGVPVVTLPDSRGRRP